MITFILFLHTISIWCTTKKHITQYMHPLSMKKIVVGSTCAGLRFFVFTQNPCCKHTCNIIDYICICSSCHIQQSCKRRINYVCTQDNSRCNFLCLSSNCSSQKCLRTPFCAYLSYSRSRDVHISGTYKYKWKIVFLK